MQKPDIWKLVLACLLPAKSEFSANDWRLYVNRYLLPEIRSETIRFYGNTDSVEARHPGLDYASPAHRLRLGAYPRHHQLFAIFDRLSLTRAEIRTLCKWEGTKQEKDDFERRMHVEIRDTTWDDVKAFKKKKPTAWLMPTHPLLRHDVRIVPAEPRREVPCEEVVEENEGEDPTEAIDTSDEESEDDIQQSVGVSLNQRLLAATAAIARGEEAEIDADWEQWMKEALERGVLLDHGPNPSLDNVLSSETESQPRLPPVSLLPPSRDSSMAPVPSLSSDLLNSNGLPPPPAANTLPISALLNRETPESLREQARSRVESLQTRISSSMGYFPSARAVAASVPPSASATTTSPAIAP